MIGNNRRKESNQIFHFKSIFMVALVFMIIGSILLSCNYNALGEKWEMSPKMLLSFGIITAFTSLLGLIGGIRLNIILVICFSIYGVILSVIVMVLAVNQLNLLPILILVMVATGSGFLYSGALRKAVTTTDDENIDRILKNQIAINLNSV